MDIRKNDAVQIIAGKDKGKTGQVIKVARSEGKIMVEGVNIVKRHQKARTQTSPSGIIEREGSIDASNVMLVDPKTGEATRIGYKVNEDGSKDRIAKKSGEVLNTVKKAKGE